MDLTALKEETFASHLNTKFYVMVGDRRVELELVKVIGDKSGLEKVEGVDRFSIFFTGPLDAFLPQHIYTLEHEALGQMEIFVVPVARRDDHFDYEAVFSHVTD